MAKMDSAANIAITIKINVSLWESIKFRIMGKEMKKVFLDKFERTIQTLESNPESNHLQ